MSYIYFEDATNVRSNQCTIVGYGGPAYNAVISTTFSDEAGTEPVSLAEAKDWMRIDVTDDDSIITRLIKAARIMCENYANLSFITRTVTAKIHNGLGNFYLPYGPVIGDISATDKDNVAIEDYSVVDSYSGDITVEYEAGFSSLPENLKTAVLCQMSYLYEKRGDEKIALNLTLESTLILNQYRNV